MNANFKMAFLSSFFLICGFAGAASQPRTPLSDSQSQALMAALVLVGAPAHSVAGEKIYALEGLTCDSADGSDMDNYFLSTCDMTDKIDATLVSVAGRRADALINSLHEMSVIGTSVEGDEHNSLASIICRVPETPSSTSSTPTCEIAP